MILRDLQTSCNNHGELIHAYRSKSSHIFIFQDRICFTPKKIHDAINMGRTSLLLNNIHNYKKIDQPRK